MVKRPPVNHVGVSQKGQQQASKIRQSAKGKNK